jgi:hypothetical protein
MAPPPVLSTWLSLMQRKILQIFSKILSLMTKVLSNFAASAVQEFEMSVAVGVLRLTKKQTPWLLVRKRTIPTERPPLVSEI